MPSRKSTAPKAQPRPSTTKKRSKSAGEDHPVIDAATLQAQVDRAAALGRTPMGRALSEAEAEIATGIALLDTAIRSLDLDDGNERETMVLSLALKRLEAAQNHLDMASVEARSGQVQS